MPQVFPKGFNTVFRVLLIALPMSGAGTGIALSAFYRSDYTTGVREVVEQPIPFSHKHHNAELGIDCRYCHSSVESSAVAGIPPTKTCMNCHQAMWTGTEALQPVRTSWETNTPIVWNKVHNVPHYTYFNHSIHLAKGVGCYSCHGEIDKMNLVFQSKTLLMEWCLDCHRAPEKHLRPRSEVFNMQWSSRQESFEIGGKKYSAIDVDGTLIPVQGQSELGRELKKKYLVRDHNTLTNCSICHR